MGERIKILYVDDEIINLQLFEAIFSDKFDVLTAENGYLGLEIIENNSDISVIISDMKMPNMNGLEFIKKLKEKLPDKKYFILTGFDITDEIKEAIESKLIIKYFKKPFNREEIESYIT